MYSKSTLEVKHLAGVILVQKPWETKNCDAYSK